MFTALLLKFERSAEGQEFPSHTAACQKVGRKPQMVSA